MHASPPCHVQLSALCMPMYLDWGNCMFGRPTMTYLSNSTTTTKKLTSLLPASLLKTSGGSIQNMRMTQTWCNLAFLQKHRPPLTRLMRTSIAWRVMLRSQTLQYDIDMLTYYTSALRCAWWCCLMCAQDACIHKKPWACTYYAFGDRAILCMCMCVPTM